MEDFERKPKQMSNIELLELYSYYCKMAFKTVEEQQIVGALRTEILERME